MKDARLVVKSWRQTNHVHTVRLAKSLVKQSGRRRGSEPVVVRYSFGLGQSSRSSVTTSGTKVHQKGQRKNKPFVRLMSFLTLVAALLLTMVAFQSNFATSRDLDIQLASVTVGAGDTLWAIAQEYHSSSDDIRDLIYYIKELNQLKTAQIHPGQELVIPAMD